MKAKYVCAALLALIFFSCDDSTPDIGRTTIAGNDSIPAGIASYDVTTRSILADSVFARSNTSYLGRYTDTEFGEFSSDFIAQFNCTDGFVFPDQTVGITKLDLTFNYETFFGDSTASMRVQVDTLNRVIPEEDRLTYYTSIDRTVPVTREVMEEDSDIERHAANCDTWGLMTVILLAGIFILDLLRLLMMFV